LFVALKQSSYVGLKTTNSKVSIRRKEAAINVTIQGANGGESYILDELVF
jgi:hypothetical protein